MLTPQALELSSLLKKKQLAHFSESVVIQLADPLEKHFAWFFEHVYSIPYPNPKGGSGIARTHHGIRHVGSAAAINVPTFANLYRKFGDAEALALNDDDLKLIQIAALCHDAAREGDNKDLWDHESGALLFYYLRDKLGVATAKALQLAEAVANKDHQSKDNENAKYYHFGVNDTGVLTYYFNLKAPPKTIYHKLIHDADCLDIIRVRAKFDAEYLDFYQQIAKKDPTAFAYQTRLIQEARSIITKRGDNFAQPDSRSKRKIQQSFENRDAYQRIMALAKDSHYYITPKFCERLLTEQELATTLLPPSYDGNPNNLTETNMAAAIWEGRIYARGLDRIASQYSQADYIIRRAYYTTHSDGEETKVPLSILEQELRKMLRKPGTPSTSRKQADGINTKTGNPRRSVSMLGPNSLPYTKVGYLGFINPAATQTVSSTDSFAGSGKKKTLEDLFKGVEPKDLSEMFAKIKAKGNDNPFMMFVEKFGPALAGSYDESARANPQELKELHQELCMGGTGTLLGAKKDFVAQYNELQYWLTDFQAVFFSHDDGQPPAHGKDKEEKIHPNSLLLQALLLQSKYLEQRQEKLPIFEYSGVHGFVKAIRDYSEQEIIQLWREMLLHTLRDIFKNNSDEKKLIPITGTWPDNDREQIKAFALYASTDTRLDTPIDQLYSDDLRKQVNQAVEEARTQAIEECKDKVLNALNSGELNAVSYYEISAFTQHHALLPAQIQSWFVSTEIMALLRSMQPGDTNKLLLLATCCKEPVKAQFNQLLYQVLLENLAESSKKNDSGNLSETLRDICHIIGLPQFPKDSEFSSTLLSHVLQKVATTPNITKAFLRVIEIKQALNPIACNPEDIAAIIARFDHDISQGLSPTMWHFNFLNMIGQPEQAKNLYKRWFERQHSGQLSSPPAGSFDEERIFINPNCSTLADLQFLSDKEFFCYLVKATHRLGATQFDFLTQHLIQSELKWDIQKAITEALGIQPVIATDVSQYSPALFQIGGVDQPEGYSLTETRNADLSRPLKP